MLMESGTGYALEMLLESETGYAVEMFLWSETGCALEMLLESETGCALQQLMESAELAEAPRTSRGAKPAHPAHRLLEPLQVEVRGLGCRTQRGLEPGVAWVAPPRLGRGPLRGPREQD